MQELTCKRCGGTLAPDSTNAQRLTCLSCGKEHPTETAEAFSRLLAACNAPTQTKIKNLLLRRHKAVTASYISSTEVTAVCRELLTLMPEDSLSEFYITAAGNNAPALNDAIRKLDVAACYEDLDEIITFLVYSLTESRECLLSLSDLVERAFGSREPERFSHYSTMISEQIERVDEYVYDTTLQRDVFVAYSSLDRDEVLPIVDALEAQDVSCFIALRNLRHGIGAVENYNAALREAMDHCTIFLFISSPNSRRRECDAVRIEMQYIRNWDIQNAPAEYRNRYETIPCKYKKPRLEYYLAGSPTPTITDRSVIKPFFDGYERVYEIDGLIERVGKLLFPEDLPSDDKEEEIRRRVEEELQRRTEADARQRAEEEAAERQRQEEARRRAAAQAAAQWKVGNTVTFGSYEQNPGRGKEPIEWIVLANEGKRALLISKYILDCQQYHPQKTAITWENCTLRKWLNSTFLNAAFNATERGRILASRIKNPKNAKYNIYGGNDTTDHIFCLSIDEANQYFATDEARAAKATPAIKAKGKIYVDDDTGNSWWWLRSPGSNARNAAIVNNYGGVYSNGDIVNYENTGVRPAFWINLES